MQQGKDIQHVSTLHSSAQPYFLCDLRFMFYGTLESRP